MTPPPLTRRDLLRRGGAAAMLPLAADRLARADDDTPTRPNIVFVIADDWGRHAGAYNTSPVPTPAFDRLAREGALFTNAFTPSPSCSPARAAILTGRYPHRLGKGADLSGPLPDQHPRYPDLLAAAGYHVGCVGKGYGPAWLDKEARKKAGTPYKDIATFFAARPKGAPFALWLGSSNPHRPYGDAARREKNVDPARVPVPPFLPDTPGVREDLADYWAEVGALDAELAALLGDLEKAGEAANTMVAVSSDNGMPFPRAKTTLYDAGCAVPLAVRWPARVKPGTTSAAFVNLIDLTPTFLEAAGVKPSGPMDGRSLLPLLTTGENTNGVRSAVFVERETHVPHQGDNGGYPMRAVRTADFLYVRNLQPERMPAGYPEPNKQFPSGFVDTDEGGAKRTLVARYKAGSGDRLAEFAFGRRPAEELYDLRTDPHQMNNLAADPRMAGARAGLDARLRRWMADTGDPRAAQLPVSAAPAAAAAKPAAPGESSARILPEARQELKGWGVFPAFYWNDRFDPALTNEEATILRRPDVQKMLYRDLGADLIRVNLKAWCYDGAKDDGSLDAAKAEPLARHLKIAREHGRTRWIAAVWSPPAVMKTPPIENGRANKNDPEDAPRIPTRLRPEREDDFVRYVARLLKHLEARGAGLPEALSVQNELTSAVRWDGCVYEPEQWRRVVKKMRRALDDAGLGRVALMGPEPGETVEGAPFLGADLSLLKTDVELGRAVRHLAHHTYDQWGKATLAEVTAWCDAAAGTGRDLWMTEWSLAGGRTDMDKAINACRHMARDLALLRSNYWFWWLGWRYKDNSGETLLVGEGPRVAPLYHVLRRLWNEARPGCRVHALSCDDPDLKAGGALQIDLCAFVSPEKAVVLLVNPAGEAKDLRLSGLPSGCREATAHRATAAGGDMAAGAPGPVAEGACRVEMPARSITVLVAPVAGKRVARA